MADINKIALIVNGTKSEWISCKTITPNIVKAYQLAFGERVRCFPYKGNQNQYASVSLAKELVDWRPDRIVFVDHQPHPEFLIYKIIDFCGWQIPPFTIHIYGDFTLYTNEWARLATNAKKLHLNLICASQAQGNLVTEFLQDPSQAPAIIPFPVDQENYQCSPELRTKMRSEFKLEDDEIAFVYSGRISLQKNSVRLLREVSGLLKILPYRAKIYFAGPFDDIAAPLMGIKSSLGGFYNHWDLALKEVPKPFRNQIKYLGNLSTNELVSLYNASDVYVSLSAHHDEDFGMAPVEAMFCGNRAILSAWGGYKGFGVLGSKCVSLVPLNLLKGGYGISQLKFRQEMVSQPFQLKSISREEISLAARDRYSITSIAKSLEKFHQSPVPYFRGFNTLINDHAAALNSPIPFKGAPCKGGLYEQVYRNYV